jgi:glycosyltransferase involved in cell wall biosynthesis
MHLGFHYHIPACLQNEQILMPGYLGCFIDSLADHCEKVVLFLHTPTDANQFQGDYALHAGNVELVDIGAHTSVPNRMLHSTRFISQFAARKSELDILLIRGPSPLLPAFAAAAGNLPVALLLVGDYLTGIDDLPQPRWRKELIRAWSRWNQSQQLAVAKRSLTFVNSHKLFQELQSFVPSLIETRTTTLTASDFYYREDTCQSPPYHLLYTGRMDRAKGLLDMVTAVANLVDRGYDCILDLVGMIEKGDPILTVIKKRAEYLGIQNRVIYHGYQPLGERLFQFYRKADIYLIASQASEGFPRTIWEAMVHSLPVVATKVGSIPSYIEGAAELIEPRQSLEIAMAVSRLIQDSDRRKHYIKAGLNLTHQNTLEQRSQEMISTIEKYLQSHVLASRLSPRMFKSVDGETKQ